MCPASVCCLMHDIRNRKVPSITLNLFRDTTSIIMTKTSCAQIRCSMRNYYLHQFEFLFLGQEPIPFCVPCLGFCISISGFGFSILLVCFFFQGFARLFPGFECLFCIAGFKENFQFFTLYNSILYFVILVLVLPFLNLFFCFGFWFSFLRVLYVYVRVLSVCFVLQA